MTVNPKRSTPHAPESRLFLMEGELDRAVELWLRASRSLWAAAEAPLGAEGLGPAHYRALAAVRREPGLTPGRLKDALGVRKQSLARVLNELQAAGLIARRENPRDRRQRLIDLTEAGLVAETAATGALRERLGLVFRAVGAEAVAGARAVLAALAHLESPEREA